MVDQIRRLQPMEPPGPMESVNDWAIYLQKVQDYMASVQSIIDRRILPQLRKREEETDTKAASSHTHAVADVDLIGATDLAAQPVAGDDFLVYDLSNTTNKRVGYDDLLRFPSQVLTADSGSIQGGSPITSNLVYISTTATTGDSVTLPSATRGWCVIENGGANSADVFPASGDSINAEADNAAVALAAAAGCICFKWEDTTWRKIDF